MMFSYKQLHSLSHFLPIVAKLDIAYLDWGSLFRTSVRIESYSLCYKSSNDVRYITSTELNIILSGDPL